MYLAAVAHAAIGRQVPETGLALPSAGHLLGSLLEAGTEAQVVTDGVLPAVRSSLKEGEVLSRAKYSILIKPI